jgi:hypothetical protein
MLCSSLSTASASQPLFLKCLAGEHAQTEHPIYKRMSQCRRCTASLEKLAGIVRLWGQDKESEGDHGVLRLFRVRVVVRVYGVEGE